MDPALQRRADFLMEQNRIKGQAVNYIDKATSAPELEANFKEIQSLVATLAGTYPEFQQQIQDDLLPNLKNTYEDGVTKIQMLTR